MRWGNDKKLLLDLFNRKDVKPINFFYFQNWYGKTTLFRLLHYIITSWWEKYQKPIPREYCEFEEDKFITYINEIWIDIQIEEYLLSFTYKRVWEAPILKLFSNSFSDYLFSEWMDFSSFFQQKVFHQVNHLVYINDNEKEKRVTTVKSLARFNFLSDQDFYKISSTECHLADTHKDGNGRWVLFNYMLGEDISKFDKYIMQSVATYLKFEDDIQMMERDKKKMVAKRNISSEQTMDNVDDYFQDISEKVLSLRTLKVKKKEIWIALARLQKMKESLVVFPKNELQIYDNLISMEEQELTMFLADLNTEEDKITWIVEQSNFKKLHEYEEFKKINWDIFRKKDFLLKNLKYVQRYKDEFYEKKRSILYANFSKIYKDLLACWYSNAFLNKQTLLVTLKKGKFRWDGHLRCARLLYLIALQIYKELYSEARLLGMLFVDAPFYWVSLQYEVNLLQHLVNYYKEYNLETQLFFFDTRITSYDRQDELCDFFEDNNDLVYVHPRNIKFNKLFSTEI